ncbi:MAG: hypothetical protein QG639_978 [Patescibacteria group bacterium]|nr:hypothetical protein [Patescibacteria group bacterium]
MIAQNENAKVAEEYNQFRALINIINAGYMLVMGATFVVLMMIAFGEGEPPPILFRESYLLTASSAILLTVVDVLQRKYVSALFKGFNAVLWTIGYCIWFYGIFDEQIGFIIRSATSLMHYFSQ